MSPAPIPVRVLVVDDELSMRHLLAAVLRDQGWEVRTAATGVDAVREARAFRPHLMVLDIVLPDVDGVRVLKALRAEHSDAMVLFLSANSAPSDRIQGIEAGGDDYVTKPFSVREVVARLHGLLRRSPRHRAEAHLTRAPDMVVGDLVLDPDGHRVARAEAAIALTATEFQLLRILMENAGRVLPKGELLEAVWGADGGRSSNILELYISYLRKKVDVGRAPMIHTVRRVGYVLRAAEGEGPGPGRDGAP
jgi:two-component system OmpR family response regulator